MINEKRIEVVADAIDHLLADDRNAELAAKAAIAAYEETLPSALEVKSIILEFYGERRRRGKLGKAVLWWDQAAKKIHDKMRGK